MNEVNNPNPRENVKNHKQLIGCDGACGQEGTRNACAHVPKAGTAAGAGVEICGYLNLNVRIVFVVSRAAAAAHSAARGESRQT